MLREAQIYLRDPAEIRSTDHALPRDGQSWLNNNTTPPALNVSLPDAVCLPYPAINGPQSGYEQVNPLETRHFLEEIGGASGPAAVPNSASSVKGLRIIDSGSCSREIDLQPYFDSISTTVENAFLENVCIPSLPAYGQINFLDMSTYLSHADGFVDNLGGGFLLRADIVASSDKSFAVFHVDPCEVFLDYEYDIGLSYGPVPGVVSVQARQVTLDYNHDRLLCNGGDFEIPGLGIDQQIPGLAPTLQVAAEQMIVDTINKETLAAETQVLPGTTCLPGTRTVCTQDSDCAPEGTFAQFCDFNDVDVYFSHSGPIGLCATLDPCGPGNYTLPDGTRYEAPLGARVEAGLAVQDGAAVLGIDPSYVPSLMSAVNAQDTNGRYTNFRCVNTDQPATDICQNYKFQCAAVVKPERLNYHPNSVELVFFETANEYSNFAFASFVGLFAHPGLDPANPPNFNNYQQLCTRQGADFGASGNFFTRTFATSAKAFEACTSLEDFVKPAGSTFSNGNSARVRRANSTPTRQSAPIVADTKCGSDSDCSEGDTCQSGACQPGPCQCMTDWDCAPNNVCLPGINPSGQPGNACFPLCDPNGYCGGDSICETAVDLASPNANFGICISGPSDSGDGSTPADKPTPRLRRPGRAKGL